MKAEVVLFDFDMTLVDSVGGGQVVVLGAVTIVVVR